MKLKKILSMLICIICICSLAACKNNTVETMPPTETIESPKVFNFKIKEILNGKTFINKENLTILGGTSVLGKVVDLGTILKDKMLYDINGEQYAGYQEVLAANSLSSYKSLEIEEGEKTIGLTKVSFSEKDTPFVTQLKAGKWMLTSNQPELKKIFDTEWQTDETKVHENALSAIIEKFGRPEKLFSVEDIDYTQIETEYNEGFTFNNKEGANNTHEANFLAIWETSEGRIELIINDTVDLEENEETGNVEKTETMDFGFASYVPKTMFKSNDVAYQSFKNLIS